MRNLGRLAFSTLLLAGTPSVVRAQMTYVGDAPRSSYAAPNAPQPYAFKDEPSMSINNSYLGYSNFVDPSYPTPRYISNHAPQSPGSTTSRPQSGRWFGWWRRHR